MNINRNIRKVTSKSVQIKFDLFPLYMSLVQPKERERSALVCVCNTCAGACANAYVVLLHNICMHEYNLSTVYRLRRITFTWYSGGNLFLS